MKQLLWSALFVFFSLNTQDAESPRLQVKAHSENTLSEIFCKKMFGKFKCADFNVRDNEQPVQLTKNGDELFVNVTL